MVDILLATYNGEKFLKEQLDSLLCQTYKDIKILIRDDGSLDGTNSIIEVYEKKYKNIITTVKDDVKTKSAKNNFFTLLKHSSADYIMFCDQDDIWLCDKIETSLNAIKKLEQQCGENMPLLVHTDLKVVDKNLNIINNSFANYQGLIKSVGNFNDLLVQNNVTGCTVIINKVVKDYIKLEIDKSILMHDWWLALICASFGKINYIDKSTILYRQHENNTVGAKSNNGIFKLVKSLKNYKIMVQNFKNTVEQAKYFKKVYEKQLNYSNLEVLTAFCSVLNKPVFTRIKIYEKYNLWKNSNIKRIAQILIHI